MRRRFVISALVLGLPAFFCCGQGTFVYDQQSADEAHIMEGSAGIQQPLGQSFTPALDSVGFARFYLFASGFGSGTFYMNLRSDSITGTIIGASEAVTLPDGFSGPVNFLFATPVSVTPQTTYYLQPIVQSGAGWGTLAATYNYAGGIAYYQGAAYPNVDFWFREGIIPEPSSAALILFGSGIFWRQLWRKKQQNPCDVVLKRCQSIRL
jgi:hypothetical protein